MRLYRLTFVAVVAAFAAFFAIIPQRGADATIEMLPADAAAAQALGASEAWRFAPGELRVARGARVAFTNRSRVTHTAWCEGCTTEWDSRDVQPGQTKMLAFTEDGTYLFVCRYHGRTLGMSGSLVVGEGGPAPEPSPLASP